MKIYAPVKDANGVYASVRFVDGVGETDNPHLIKWFIEHGYKVPLEDDDVADNGKIVDEIPAVETENVADETEEDEMMGYADKTPETPNFDEMTPLEIRDWAKANGHGSKIKNIRNKEKLIELLRG